MTASEALPAVLDRVDRDLDASLERLFTLLRIQSISTDPAFAGHCREAADHVAADLKSLGFQTSVRPTPGHPIVVGKSGDGIANGKAPRVLFYGHYDVQPVDPLDLWQTPPFEPRIETLPDGRKIIVARGACDDKGQAMTFVEACRAFKAVTGKLPLDITMLLEGEEECGSKNLFGFVRDNAGELKRDLALVCDTGMWDAADSFDHDLAAGACVRGSAGDLRRPRSALGPVRRRGAQPDPCAGRRALGDAHGGRRRRPFPASMTASMNCRQTSRRTSPVSASRRKNSSVRSG